MSATLFEKATRLELDCESSAAGMVGRAKQLKSLAVQIDNQTELVKRLEWEAKDAETLLGPGLRSGESFADEVVFGLVETRSPNLRQQVLEILINDGLHSFSKRFQKHAKARIEQERAALADMKARADALVAEIEEAKR